MFFLHLLRWSCGFCLFFWLICICWTILVNLGWISLGNGMWSFFMCYWIQLANILLRRDILSILQHHQESNLNWPIEHMRKREIKLLAEDHTASTSRSWVRLCFYSFVHLHPVGWEVLTLGSGLGVLSLLRTATPHQCTLDFIAPFKTIIWEGAVCPVL